MKRKDAEMDYLSSFIGAEYINPGNESNAEKVAPLEEKRQYTAFIVTKLEEKLAELEGRGAPVPEVAQDAQSPARSPEERKGMWGGQA
jgi:hypothetical protein